MADKGFILSEKDRNELRRLGNEQRDDTVNTRARRYLPENDHQAPELYIALTPAAGIPARFGLLPGFADCIVWQIAMETTPPQLSPGAGLTVTVFNIGLVPVDGDDYVLIQRDKYGRYLITERADVGTVATGTGPPPCDCPPPVVVTDVIITTIVGDTNITYVVYNSTTNTVTTYLWICINGVCGWLNLCTCVWKPFIEPYWCVDETIPMAWWCVKTVAGTGSGSVSSAVNCPKCPGGAPLKWLLNVASVSTTPFQALAGSWELEWFASPDYAAAGLCVWSTTPGTTTFPRWVLTYSPFLDAWVLVGQVSGSYLVHFQLDGSSFYCCGPNIMLFREASSEVIWLDTQELIVVPDAECTAPGAGGPGTTPLDIYTCVQAYAAPEGAVGGPYGSESECLAACNAAGTWAPGAAPGIVGDTRSSSGGVGGTAYTLDDVVRVLKKLGVMAP